MRFLTPFLFHQKIILGFITNCHNSIFRKKIISMLLWRFVRTPQNFFDEIKRGQKSHESVPLRIRLLKAARAVTNCHCDAMGGGLSALALRYTPCRSYSVWFCILWWTFPIYFSTFKFPSNSGFPGTFHLLKHFRNAEDYMLELLGID